MSRYFLGCVLLLALVLRVSLALHGGQYFFPDESRFLRGILLYRSLLHGQWELAAQALTTAQHAAFPLVGILVGPFAHGLAILTGTGDWSKAAEIRASAPMIASVLCLFSVANVWLVHRIALAYGAVKNEADLAALLAAVSGSLFFYARHLLPYDCALTAALGGLLLAAGAPGPMRCLLAGVCAGLCVALYAGYWFLAPVIGLALLARPAAWRERLRSGALGALGGVLALGLVLLPGAVRAGADFWRALARFSGTVTQGLFAEGWSLPGEFLWQTEGALGVAVLLVVLGAAPALFARGDRSAHRARLWLGLAAVIYLLLAVCSTVLHKFVVYGRTVRPMTFFFCLAGAWALERLLQNRPRWRPAALAGIVGLAVINILPHFQVTFPEEAKVTVWSSEGVPKFTSTFSGIAPDATWPLTTRPDLAMVNPLSLYPLRAYVAPPAGRVLAEWRHPYALKAYHYEGHTPRERRLFREHPPSIQLLALAQPASVPEYPPVEFFMTRAEFADGFDRR